MTEEREQRFIFGEVAETYHRTRPGYPPAVAEYVLGQAGIAPGTGRLLEVGAGTGKATVTFARDGHAITALEPSPEMAAVARRVCAEFPQVAVVESTFEAWPQPAPTFDLVYAAQSWHWVDRDAGAVKARLLLPEGGFLALFWNRPEDEDLGLRDELDRLHERYAPSLSPLRPWQELQQRAADEPLLTGGYFGAAAFHAIPHRVVYSADEYVALMETQSDHRLLPEEERKALHAAIHAAVRDAGGTLAVWYVTDIVTARAI